MMQDDSATLSTMQRFGRYFLQGLLIVAPVAVTIYVIFWLFSMMDVPLGGLVERIAGRPLPGVGALVFIILALVFLTFVGFLSGNILARAFGEMMQRQLNRFPLLKLIHASITDLVEAFVGRRKRFDQPVLVRMAPGSEAFLAGFVTRKSMEQWGMEEYVAVYVPMAFNFGGNMLIVPREQVKALSVPSGDVMAFMVSGGITGNATMNGDKGSDNSAA